MTDNFTECSSSQMSLGFNFGYAIHDHHQFINHKLCLSTWQQGSCLSFQFQTQRNDSYKLVKWVAISWKL